MGKTNRPRSRLNRNFMKYIKEEEQHKKQRQDNWNQKKNSKVIALQKS